jgi:nucleotide-binding universal stress UspA family protein
MNTDREISSSARPKPASRFSTHSVVIRMFQKVLFPIEVSESAEILIAAAEEIVMAGADPVTLLHVVRPEEALADPSATEYARIALER